MKHIILVTLFSFVLSGCGILEGFIVEDRPETAPQADHPPSLILMRDESIEMNLGTYCWTSTDVGLCVDMMPPVYEADSHINVSGDSLNLSFDGVVPSSISAYVHPGNNLMTRIADIQLSATLNADGTVTIPLIEQLNGDYVLVVSAFWQDSPSGDAMYSLPITVE